MTDDGIIDEIATITGNVFLARTIHGAAPQRTVDPEERKQYIHTAQRVEYERGGYIVWGASFSFDAVSAKVQGAKGDAIDPLASHDLRELWFS